MQGQKAVVIIIVAMFLTCGIGIVFQTTHQNVDKTITTYKGDLTPAVQYETINEWTEYNPLTNVTGWSPSTAISTMPPGVANQYLLTPSVPGYDDHNVTATPKYLPRNAQLLDIPNAQYNKVIVSQDSNWGVPSMGWINSSQIVDGPIGYTTDRIGYVKTDSLDGMTLQTDYIQGGYGQMYESSEAYGDYPKIRAIIFGDFTINLLDQTTLRFALGYNSSYNSYNNMGYIVPLSEYVTSYSDKWVIHSPENVSIFSQDYIHVNDASAPFYWASIFQIDTTITETNYKDWVYSSDNQLWYPAQEIDGVWKRIEQTNGYPLCSKLDEDLGYSVNGLCLYRYDMVYPRGTSDVQTPSSNTSPLPTITYSEPIISNPSYADPTKFVIVQPSEVVDWTSSNGTVYWRNNEINGTIYLLASKNVQIRPYSGYNTYSDVVFTVPLNIPYSYILITLDFVNNSFTCKGINSSSSPMDFNTLDYSITDYSYEMGITYLSEGASIPQSVPALMVKAGPDFNGNTANGYCYIVDTIVQVDPLSILWGNPYVNIQYYFPDQVTHNTRIIFNSFVTYGKTLSINADPASPDSHTFTVSDGKLNIVYSLEYNLNTLRVTSQPDNNTYTMSMYIDSQSDTPYWLYTDKNGTVWTVTPNYTENQITSLVVTDDSQSSKFVVSESKSSGVWKYKSTTGYTMKGMAVDYLYNGPNVYVSILFTEDNSQRVDLGKLDQTPVTTPISGNTTKAGYLIYGTGNWYWQANLNDVSIEHTEEIVLDISNGFGLTVAGACLVFLLMMVICLAVVRYLDPEGFGFIDWIVFVITGMFAVILMTL